MAPPKPPPARKASAKTLQALQALHADEEFNARMQKPATEAMFYDHGAPSTVDRRQRARANFKSFCEMFYGETEERDMYAAATLIDRVCRFIEGMARASSGILQAKVQIGTLIQYRQSLEWWISVMTPSFSSFKTEFHTRVSRHIHLIAVTQQLSTEHRPKNNLGEFELRMFLDQIKLEQKRVHNLKQHYVAWVLAFITGARPGSFTVASRYRKGSSMGGAASEHVPRRSESHTLRWSDIDFHRMQQGIACNLTFRFNKGHQDPYKLQNAYVEGRREWFFHPKQQDLYLDLSVLLFSLAYERGLFVDSLSDLLQSDVRLIKKDPVVNKQAVFVAADSEGNLIPEQDMGYGSLNPKLQEVCRSVGLFDYNNMYAFRREAASVTKHDKGLASAQELLNHVPSSKVAYIHYDPKGFGRRDSTAFRLGGPELSQSDIRKYFSQAASAWTPSETQATAAAEIKTRIDERLLDHEEYAELENSLEGILVEAHELLQGVGRIANDEGYTHWVRNVAKYKGMMQEDGTKSLPGISEIVEKLDRHLVHRKTRRRDIRAALVKEITKLMQADAGERQKITSMAAPEVDATTVEDGAEEDEELDEAAIAGGRDEEPELWKSVGEGHVFVVPDDNDIGTEPDETARAVFIKEWLDLGDSEVKRSKLRCYRCMCDPTMTQDAKEKEWILVKYHTHLKSDVHSRRMQLLRAFKVMKKEMDVVECPLCDRKYKAANKFMLHLESDHPEELWEKDDDDAGEEGSDDAGEERSDDDDNLFDEEMFRG